MISDLDLKRCAEIEFNCWQKNLAPLLNITEYLYFQTKASFERELKKLLQDKNAHILLSHAKKTENPKKSSSQTLVPQGVRRGQN